MKFLELPIGAKVELNILNGEETIIHKTVVDEQENGKLFVVAPLKNFLAKREITLLYFDGLHLFKWDCKLGTSKMSNNVLLYELIPFAEDGFDYNRRYGFRVPYVTKMSYFARNENYEMVNIVGKMKDISISGIGFYTPKKHDVGEIIDICFDVKTCSERGEMRIVREGKPVDGMYFYGAQFLSEASDSVSRLINEVQMTQIRSRRYM